MKTDGISLSYYIQERCAAGRPSGVTVAFISQNLRCLSTV